MSITTHNRHQPQTSPLEKEASYAESLQVLHADIFETQRGVPSVENYIEAGQLAAGIEYDPVKGVYTGPNGQHLAGDIAEEIMHVARPQTWLQPPDFEDVLPHAKNLLTDKTSTANHSSALDLAVAVVARTGANPDTVSAETLDRMIALDTEAHKQLARQRVSKAAIDRMEEQNKDEVVSILTGKPAGPGTHSDENIVYDYDPGKVSLSKEYAKKIVDDEDGVMLARLVKDGRVTSKEAVASALYPEKMASGSSVHNRLPIVADALSNPRRTLNSERRKARLDLLRGHKAGLENLTPAERAEVEAFDRQMGIVRNFEDTVIRDFEDGVAELPPSYVIAGALFSGIPNRELTPSQQEAVNAVQQRLREVRLAQTHQDRTAWLRMRMEAAADFGDAVAYGFKEFGHKVSAARFRVGQIAGATALSLTLAFASLPGQHHRAAPAMVASASPLSVAVRGRRGLALSEEQAMDQYPYSLPFGDRVRNVGIYPHNRRSRSDKLGAVATGVGESKAVLSDKARLIAVKLELLKNAALEELVERLRTLKENPGVVARRLAPAIAGLVFIGAGVVSFLQHKAGKGPAHGGAGTQLLADAIDTMSQQGDSITPASMSFSPDDALTPDALLNTVDPDIIRQQNIIENGTTEMLGRWDPNVTDAYGNPKGTLNNTLTEHIQELDLDSLYSELTSKERGKLTKHLMEYNNFSIPDNKMPSNLQVKLPPRALMEQWIAEAQSQRIDTSSN